MSTGIAVVYVALVKAHLEIKPYCKTEDIYPNNYIPYMIQITKRYFGNCVSSGITTSGWMSS